MDYCKGYKFYEFQIMNLVMFLVYIDINLIGTKTNFINAIFIMNKERRQDCLLGMVLCNVTVFVLLDDDVMNIRSNPNVHHRNFQIFFDKFDKIFGRLW